MYFIYDYCVHRRVRVVWSGGLSFAFVLSLTLSFLLHVLVWV